MTALAIAAAYLVGIITTAVYLTQRPPSWLNPDIAARDLRTARPGATEQQIQDTARRSHKATSLVASVFWPLLVLAAAIDYPGIMWRRWRAQRSAITVGKTITVHGRPMLVTSISEQWGDGGYTATFTCAGPSPRRLPGITVRGDRP